MIIRCIVPGISSTTDQIFCHFGLFALFPPNNPENQNFEKIKKICGGNIILQMSTINQSHIWFLRYEVHQTELFCHLGPNSVNLYSKEGTSTKDYETYIQTTETNTT